MKTTLLKLLFVFTKSAALSAIIVVPTFVRLAVATAASCAGFVKSVAVYNELLMLLIV